MDILKTVASSTGRSRVQVRWAARYWLYRALGLAKIPEARFVAGVNKPVPGNSEPEGRHILDVSFQLPYALKERPQFHCTQWMSSG